jgi:hypothetical protein
MVCCVGKFAFVTHSIAFSMITTYDRFPKLTSNPSSSGTHLVDLLSCPINAGAVVST